jgi:hypothetical protein
MHPDDGDLYGGLSGVTIEVDGFHLDGGVTLSTTFAPLMCPFLSRRAGSTAIRAYSEQRAKPLLSHDGKVGFTLYWCQGNGVCAMLGERNR